MATQTDLKPIFEKPGYIILSIDLSLRNTGIAVLDQKGILLETKVIKPANKLKGALRLKFIRDEVSAVIKEHSPDVVAMEGYSFNSTGKLFDIGEAGGVVKLLLLESNLPVIIVPPKNVKVFLTQSGNADKAQVISAIHKRYKILLENDNQADAFGIAQMVLFFKDRTPEFCEKGSADKIRELVFSSSALAKDKKSPKSKKSK